MLLVRVFSRELDDDERRRRVLKGNIFQRQFSLFNSSFLVSLDAKPKEGKEEVRDREEHFGRFASIARVFCRVFYRANEFVLHDDECVSRMRKYIRNNEREDKIIFARPELRRKNSPRREF